MADPLTVVVDRIEGDIAVLEVQWMAGPRTIDVLVEDLPPGTVEGERLIVRFEKEAHRG